ncbi:MAG TPA: GNAT family N-acetyltransferase [Caulobacteraceae bacterium]|jgi:predicted acetyltransferase
MTVPTVTLRRPALEILPGYVAALQRGWSADNVRGHVAAEEELRRIGEDAQAFVDSLDDREARGASVVLPDGSTVQRIPGFRRWVWDGDFCGSIGFRWSPGTSELPPHVLGHIGYAIVPWKRGKGYASLALRLLLPEAWSLGLAHVDITTDPDNVPSQKVILNNGGWLVGLFRKPDAFGGGESMRYRIPAPR